MCVGTYVCVWMERLENISQVLALGPEEDARYLSSLLVPLRQGLFLNLGLWFSQLGRKLASPRAPPTFTSPGVYRDSV